MQSDLIEFEWLIAEEGHEWITVPPGSQPPGDSQEFLTEKAVSGSWKRFRRYHPLGEHSGLFRTLAQTEADKQAILAFAHKFGMLGGKTGRVLQPQAEPEVFPSAPIPRRMGEPFSEWRAEILALRELVQLWDLTQSGDDAALAQRIRWDDDYGGVDYRSDPKGVLQDLPIAGRGTNNDLLSNLPPGDLILPARYYLQSAVNGNLRNHGVTARLLWDRDLKRLSMRFSPDSLNAAIWVQFAEAISEDRRYGQCEECQKWFELTTERRADAKFCSGACRSRAYRKRQAGARHLHSQGVPVKEIARRLDTDVEKVTTWVER